MRREEKIAVIESISAQLRETPDFYITDIAGLNAEQTTKLRRACNEKGIKLTVVKNTLLAKAIEAVDNDEIRQLLPVLVGNTALMFTTAASEPAKLIKKLLKGGLPKPLLKGAYLQQCAYVGEDKLEALASIKSKEELIGDIIGLLQSPARNVISALESAGGKLAGIVKTLSEKE